MPTDPTKAASDLLSSLMEAGGGSLSVDHIKQANALVKQVQTGESVAAKAAREHQLKLIGGAALVVLLMVLVYSLPEAARPEQVKQILTALIAAIPTGFAAFFAGKNAKKE